MSGGSLLKKELPYDYEVEYLENNNTGERISTGIVGGPGLKIETYFTSLELATEKWAIASWDTGAGRLYAIYQNPAGKWGAGYGGYATNIANMNINTVYHTVIEYTNKEQIVTVNGNEIIRYNKSSNFKNTKPLQLFTLGIQSQSFRCRIGHTRIWMYDVLVRDFIPVVRDSVGCMYDKVSKQLFYNQGTGNFIVGPRVS